MNKNVVRSTGLALALVSCGSEQAINLGSHSIDTVASTQVAGAVSDKLADGLKETTLSLLMRDVPVNIVVLPTAYQDSRDYAKERRAEYATNSPGATAPVEDLLYTASDGEFNNQVSFTQANVVADLPNGCVEEDDTASSEYRKTATPFFLDGAVNIVMVDAVSCKSDQDGNSGFAGYAYVDSPLAPILSSEAANGLPYVVLHELGHSIGLSHAGSASCNNALLCGVSDTGDNLSLMGYSYSSSKFSASERAQLGILQPERIISNPKTGEYKLVLPEHKIGKALLQLTTDSGEVSISWESDNLTTEQYCDPVDIPEGWEQFTLEQKRLYYEETHELTGSFDLKCADFGGTIDGATLQLRVPNNNGGQSIVMYPDRTQDGIYDNSRYGLIEPTIVYADENYVVAFEGYNQATEQATVFVTNNTVDLTSRQQLPGSFVPAAS